jgi:hypothetical protein
VPARIGDKRIGKEIAVTINDSDHGWFIYDIIHSRPNGKMRKQESACRGRMQEIFAAVDVVVIFGKSFGVFQMTKCVGSP